MGEAILQALARIRGHNPQAAYCCDPVMGDVGRGFFVRPGIPEFMRDRAVPAATITTPNQFELEFLTGLEVTTLLSALEALQRLRQRGPGIVLVKSLRHAETPSDEIEMLAAGPGEAYRVATPLLPVQVNGAGDATAALFFAHYLLTGSIKHALEATANSIFAILEKTVEMQAREIQLVAARSAIVTPPRRFKARRVG